MTHRISDQHFHNKAYYTDIDQPGQILSQILKPTNSKSGFHSLWIQHFRLSDIFSFIIVSTVAFVTILNTIVSRRLFRADVSTQFNCHVVVTCYGITIKNSSIIGEIHDTYSVSCNRVNAHGPGASTDLFEITTATAITLARPCPFKSIFGFVTTIALH